MDDISKAVIEAWERVCDRLKNDPEELARRLARKRMKALSRPPRGWCLAIRASDTRINEVASLVPECAVSGTPQYWRDHEVIIDAELVKKLCRGVRIEAWGETVPVVTRKLGLSAKGLEEAIRGGTLKVEWGRGERGTRARVVKCDATLDPSAANLKRPVDEAYGSMWQHLADNVPGDLSQRVRRSIVWRSGHGFWGWRWVCPRCGRKVRTLFYPMPVCNLPEFFGIEWAMGEKVERKRQEFACGKCHDVWYFSRVGSVPWDLLIYHLSGGLLYGHEVKRPKWLGHERRREFRAHLRREPSKRRQEVLELLVKGWKYRQIAAELGTGYATVCGCVKEIYRQHRVHGREELRRLMEKRRGGARVELKGGSSAMGTRPSPLPSVSTATLRPGVPGEGVKAPASR